MAITREMFRSRPQKRLKSGQASKGKQRVAVSRRRTNAYHVVVFLRRGESRCVCSGTQTLGSHEPRGGGRIPGHIPRRHRRCRLAAKDEGPRLRGRVARMGKSMDRQKNFRCLSLAGPTQQPKIWPHPSQGPQLGCSASRKKKRLGHTSHCCCSRARRADTAEIGCPRPTHLVAARLVEAWTFLDNGGEGSRRAIVAWDRIS